MHLRSLSLRNYRVYRSVDLEFPDGLVGIYGANGSGKTTLIEAVRYACYGDARTDKWELRTVGVGEDVRVELVFEHEGNTYDVRRRLKGRNLTPEVEVFLNGQLAAQSVREANAYLARVLGMDQRAFLASVCAQQNELTAFATMVPGERRRLVLDLLGVSPVERALANVRERARDAKAASQGARAGLPDLAEQAARQRQAEAEQAAADAEQTAKALEELRGRARLARTEAAGHREQANRHEERAAQADRLGPDIETAAARVAELAAAAESLDALEQAREQAARRAHLAQALEEAHGRRRTSERALAMAERDAKGAEERERARAAADGAVEAADAELATARERHAELSEAAGAAAARLEAARTAAELVAALDPEAPCPTCGQPLGDSHAEVRHRHAKELQRVERRHTEAIEARRAAVAEGKRLAERRAVLVGEREQAAAAEAKAAKAAALAEAAAAARQEAAIALAALERRLAQAEEERGLAKEALARADLADGRALAVDAEAARLGPADAELAAARERRRAAAEAATAAHGERRQTAEALAAARRRGLDRTQALEAARAQHERVAGLEEAAGLFAELTDHEYQDLVVDPEDYAIRIADAGTEHELARFSGSENDLASLSLRVAVSLVIAEAAGELGLLVLDEVLGALDRERRELMLNALTRLQGRFRQVLLVTHNDEVKDLLPAAIEVRRSANRISTATLRE